MEDLLASIRKIIADDVADRPRSAVRPVRVAPSLHREPHPPRRAPEADPDLSLAVERSMLDAFGVVDAERDEPVQPARSASAVDDGEEAEIEAAVNSIAEAIAAERQARSGADLGSEDWAGDILGEPGLDAAVPQRPAAQPAVAKGAAARVASLRIRHEAPDRSVRPERQPAEQLPANVYRLDPGERTPEMSDAAVDPKLQDGDGNVFRRQPAARAELDDGLTSARTRQSVSSQFDQLSRTILTNNPRTLEDLVRDMVRPLLREWLEANLPDIVERQVRQEIDRVSARGR